MNECCLEHSGHKSKIENLERGQKVIAHNTESAHRRIDGMKNWVIAGMTALVLQLAIVVIKMLSSKPVEHIEHITSNMG